MVPLPLDNSNNNGSDFISTYYHMPGSVVGTLHIYFFPSQDWTGVCLAHMYVKIWKVFFPLKADPTNNDCY